MSVAATPRITVVCGILITFLIGTPCPYACAEEHSVNLTIVADGIAQLRFSAPTGSYSRLEVTGDLLRPFEAASGWFFGSGQAIQTPVYLRGTPPELTQESETFTVYPFTNGSSLVIGTNNGGLPIAGLVNQDYRSLPPFHIQPAINSQVQLNLQRGSLSWNPGYTAYDFSGLPVDARAVLERLTTRYADITNTLTQGGPPGWSSFGPGLFLPGTNFFFRIARFSADEDSDGLDWESETFLTGTDPQLPDSDSDGTPDGIEDLDSDHIPNADEIQFGLNPRLDDAGASRLSQAFTYDGLHRLRRVTISGTVVWQATLDAQGNITRVDK